MKIELITWHDAGSTAEDLEWSDLDTQPEEEESDIVIRSVGFVVRETAKYVTICMDLSDDNQAHTKSRIPVGMIVSRQVLKEDK